MLPPIVSLAQTVRHYAAGLSRPLLEFGGLPIFLVHYNNCCYLSELLLSLIRLNKPFTLNFNHSDTLNKFKKKLRLDRLRHCQTMNPRPLDCSHPILYDDVLHGSRPPVQL